MRKKYLFVLAAILTVLLFHSASYAQSQQITNGLNYLTATQNPDGSWGNEISGTEILPSTVAVIETLKALNQTSMPSYSNAFFWLQTQDLETTDYLSERIHALLVAGTDEALLLTYVDELSGAWGGYDDYEINNLDTAFALQALRSTNSQDQNTINSAISYILSTHNADGGWGLEQGDDSNIYMTALVSSTLQQFPQTTSIATAVSEATAYLIANQNTDGGFGAGASTVYETALSYIAMINAGQGQAQPLQIPIQNAIAYLTAAQSANGSWNDDPYSTALALRALADVKPNLTILSSDITFSKPNPTVGDTISIAATIHNAGLTQADNVSVQFYDNDPNFGGILIGETTIASISAYGNSPASINYTLTTASSKTIYVSLDPLNTIDELNEADNTASKNLTSATLPDLSITSADITIAPSAPEPGEAVTIMAIARNKGETSAGNVTVDFYDGDPAAGGALISRENALAIGPGEAAYLQISSSLPAGEHTIYAILDKDGLVTESDETNNSAPKTISVGAAVDLSVSAASMTFSPLNPKVGDSVTVSAQVKNIASGTARNIVVRFYLGDSAAGGSKIGADIILPEVPGGGTADVNIPWDSTGHAGNNNLYIAVDPDDSIAEITEYNNKAFRTLKVAAAQGPDFTLTSTDITFSPQSLLQGDLVTVSAVIKNTGSQTGKNVVVQFSIYDSAIGSSLIIDNQTILSLASGSSATLQVTWDTMGFSGEYEIIAEIDPMNTVAETNETNNTAQIPVTVTAPQGPDISIALINTSGITSDTQTLTVSGSAAVTIKNRGTLDTALPFVLTAFEDRNNNQAYDPGVDIVLGQTTYSGNLPSGAEDTVTMPVSGTIASINNALYVAADSGNAVTEINETNNIGCLAIFTACRNANVDRAVKTGASWLIDHQLNVDAEGTMKAWGGASLYYSALAVKAYYSTSHMSQTKYASVLNKLIQMQAPDGSWDESLVGTAGIIITLNYVGYIPDPAAIQDAVAWVAQQQNSDGSWGGTANSTGYVLTALIRAGVAKNEPFIQRAAQWLINTQNPDGYWGEYQGQPSNSFIGPYPAIGLALATSPANPNVIKAKSYYYADRSSIFEVIRVYWLMIMTEIEPTNGEINYIASSLLNYQRSDGGWQYHYEHPYSAFDMTAWTLDVFGRRGITGTGVEKGILWLDSHFNVALEGFSERKDISTTDTALDALQAARIGDPSVLNSITKGRLAIVRNQSAAGKWSYTIPPAVFPWITPSADSLFMFKYNISSLTIEEQKAAIDTINYLIGTQLSSDNGWPPSDIKGFYTSSDLASSMSALRSLLQYGMGSTQTNVSRGLSYLNTMQTQAGGFGSSGYTAQAAIIYKLAGTNYQSRLTQTITWLKANQNPDGGWGSMLGYTSTTGNTSWALIALSYAGESGIEVAKGVSWLLAAQNEDNGWGALMGIPVSYENTTALAVWALSLSRFTVGFDLDLAVDKPYYCPGDPVKITATPDKPTQDISLSGSVTLQEGGSYPISFSDTGTSFVSEFTVPSGALPGAATVHVTGTAPYGYGIATSSFIVKNCSSLLPDLSISDADISATVQNPQNPDTRLVSATIRNLGDMAANNITVNFYKGAPLSANIIESQTLSTIGPSGEATVNTVITITDDTLIYVTVDPDNAIAELDENNNTAALVLTRKIADLSLSSSDISLIPPVIEGQSAKITAVIHNIGNLGASDIVVSFYDGDPQGSGTLIGSQTKAFIDAGATALAEVTWNTFEQSGTNYIHVVVDSQNLITESNENNNSTLILADVASPTKPDLAITSSDITFSNLNPQEGEHLVITATVHNLGTEASDIKVNLYNGNPSAGGALLSTYTLAQVIPFGGQAQISLSVDTVGLSGNHEFHILLDPDNAIDETNETNNTAWNSLTIGPSGLSLGVTADKTSYNSNENVLITVNTGNLTDSARTGTLEVRMTDLNSNVVSTVASQAVTLGSGPSGSNCLSSSNGLSCSYSWNTGRTLSGGYKVYAVYVENGNVTAKADTPIAITKDMNISSKVTTDKVAYYPNQPVTITSTITSLSANYIFEDLTAKIAVSDQLSAVSLYEETQIVSILIPGQLVELKTYWNTGTTDSGDYPVTLEIRDASGTVLSASTTTLTISSEVKPSKLLKGTISVDRQSLLQGEPVAITYSVTNIGNMDLSQINLSVKTVHTVQLTVYDTLTDQTELLKGETYANSQQLNTQNYSAKDYLVILRANISGVEETLASTYFRVEGAPSAPSLNEPAHGSDIEILTPALVVNNASDPNDDKLTYQLELYADSGLSTLVSSADGIAEGSGITTWQMPSSLTENSTYYWRARAFDGRLYGQWMAPASFRVNVENDVPAAPTLSAPADHTSVDSVTPMLSVNNAYDPDSLNLTYNFEVSQDASFTSLVASEIGVAEGIGTTSWQLPVSLQENTWYYWRAQADDWLATSPWMIPAGFFVNTANDAPTVPGIISPADGSSIPTVNADIVAANGTDPDSTVLNYLFEVDTVTTFDSPDLIVSVSITEGQGTTSFSVAGLRDNTTYCSRAKTSDALAESPWSAVSCFFVNTANDAPTAPVLANPSNGSGVNVFSPVFSVHNSADLDKDPLTYEFEVYGDVSLSGLVAGVTGISETPDITSGTVPVNLIENSTYYWRARAYDGKAYSPWMPVASFMVNTSNDAPGAPSLSAPSNGVSLATLSPILAVNNATDPDSDSLTYDFEVYAGGTLVWTTTGIPQDASGITSATVSPAISDNMAYTWRARAYDGDRYGAWMDMASFSTHMPSSNITVTMEVEPETLNRKSRGNWVTVEIELPRGYHAKDVQISSIRLEGTVHAETKPYHRGCEHNREHHHYDNDKDHDDREIKVKFDRREVLNVLPNGEHVKVHVTGIVGTTTFEGVDTIRVIH